MMSFNRLLTLMGAFVALAFLAAPVRAQEATPAPEATVAPTMTPQPTLMDQQYDGRTHVMLAPYIWAPTVKGSFQYSIPTLPHRPGGVTQSNVSIAPTDYVSNLNSGAMFAFDARKGDIDVFGDYIYVNASASASASAIISGRFGKIQIPVSLSTNAHFRQSIWEAALGVTVARGHDADLSIIAGLRETPLNLNFDYSATVGKRGILTPTGTITTSAITQDVVFGLRGKAFFGDGRFFVPYYADVGTGAGQVGNTTWQAYGGGGYAFSHGQTLLLAYRALDYDSFAPVSHVQRLSLGGPLLGYTFNL